MLAGIEVMLQTAEPDALLEDFQSIISKVTSKGGCNLNGLISKVPVWVSIAMKRSKKSPALSTISEHLLTLVVRHLDCTNGVIMQKAETALIALLEQGLLTKAQAEIHVCPTILASLRGESMRWLKTHGIALIAKLIPVLGRDIAERVFLDRYIELCSDRKHYVREACASVMGDFCRTLSQATFEKILFPAYQTLCTDEAWIVRMACADVAIFVSSVCSAEARQTILAPIFLQLLKDKCEWVRGAASSNLGAFIATFATPSITSLAYNENGQLVLVSQGCEFRIKTLQTMNNECYMKYRLNKTLVTSEDCLCDDEGKSYDTHRFCAQIDRKRRPLFSDFLVKRPKSPELADRLENVDLSDNEQIVDNSILNASICADSGGTKTQEGNDEENLEMFNSYNYWYVPPDMPLDPSIVASVEIEKTANIVNTTTTTPRFNDAFEDMKAPSPSASEDEANESSEADILPPADATYIAEKEPEPHIENENSEGTNEEKTTHVVDQGLLDHFFHMSNLKSGRNETFDLYYQCAYSLPAVALTLGSDSSELFAEVLENLRSTRAPLKARLTLASSIHELAKIWGADISSKMLTPVFNDLVEDGDEVRMGFLKNLASFFEHISPSVRSTFLPRLEFILLNSEVVNWRFRYEFARQMEMCVAMFTPGECRFIGALLVMLLKDPFAAVREVTLDSWCELLRHINSHRMRTYASRWLVYLAEEFAHSKNWKRRQTYVLLCAKLLKTKAIPMKQFACDVLPHLLDLSWDLIANIRLVVARTIAAQMITNEYFQDAESQHTQTLHSVLRRLQVDKDRDVRQCALTDCPNIMY